MCLPYNNVSGPGSHHFEAVPRDCSSSSPLASCVASHFLKVLLYFHCLFANMIAQWTCLFLTRRAKITQPLPLGSSFFGPARGPVGRSAFGCGSGCDYLGRGLGLGSGPLCAVEAVIAAPAVWPWPVAVVGLSAVNAQGCSLRPRHGCWTLACRASVALRAVAAVFAAPLWPVAVVGPRLLYPWLPLRLRFRLGRQVGLWLPSGCSGAGLRLRLDAGLVA